MKTSMEDRGPILAIKTEIQQKYWEHMWEGLFEGVQAGDFSRDDANTFIMGFNLAQDLVSLSEIESEYEVRVKGTICLDFETSLMMPVEPTSDEGLDELVVMQFERAMDTDDARNSLSVQDVRVTQATIEED